MRGSLTRARWWALGLLAMLLAAPALASASEEFKPQDEFELTAWVPI